MKCLLEILRLLAAVYIFWNKIHFDQVGIHHGTLRLVFMVCTQAKLSEIRVMQANSKRLSLILCF